MPANNSIIEFSRGAYLENFDIAQRLYRSWCKNVSSNVSFGKWRYNHVGDYTPRALDGVNGVMRLKAVVDQTLRLKLQEVSHGP